MSSSDNLQRSALPIPDLAFTGTVTYDATDPDTSFPKIKRLLPPEGAPNVLVVLIDDVGFGASSAIGGPVQTPNFERVAAAGLKYTRFHTTALCSPTRAALLSGRNHHTVGMGGITEIATSAPGCSSLRRNTCAPLAETLKLNGYSTAQFGKCHEVPVWQASAVGPFDGWPSPGNGFEYFYGFLGGETNQWYPAIYEGTTPVEPWGTPEDGYHFMDDMTDKAIAWTRQQKSIAPDKPFFTYFAPGATHAPHHVPTEWADKYAGQFDQGWDELRKETFARQLELGVIPQNAVLTERSTGIPAWDEMSEALKPALARQMEVYAGFLAYADHHVGRLLDALEELDALEDTLVYVIIGDNGASAEGSMHGTTNEGFTINHMNDIEDEAYVAAHIDDLGTPSSYNHYAVGLGARDGHALPVDQAGRLALGRHPQRHHRQLARRHRGARGDPQPVRPLHRRRPDRSPSGRHPGAAHGPRCHPTALRGHPDELHVRRRRRRGAARHTVLRDGREPGDLPQGLDRGRQAQGPVAGLLPRPRRGRLGALQRRGGLDPVPRPGRRRSPSGWRTCSSCSSSRPPGSTCCPSTSARPSGLTPTSPAGPALITADTQTFYPGMRRMSENSTINIKNKSWTVAATATVPDGSPLSWCRHRPGRRLRWLELLRPRGHAPVRVQPARDLGRCRNLRHHGPGRRARAARALRLRRRRRGQGRHGEPLRR